jgi:heme/copper-type cytochrome/quinol oxidase subunit 1
VKLWNVAVLAGHTLMFVTVAAFASLAVKTFTGDGESSVDDPWEAHTLEWATSSPAPVQNFADVHTVASPEPLLDLHAGPGDPETEHRP